MCRMFRNTFPNIHFNAGIYKTYPQDGYEYLNILKSIGALLETTSASLPPRTLAENQ